MCLGATDPCCEWWVINELQAHRVVSHFFRSARHRCPASAGLTAVGYRGTVDPVVGSRLPLASDLPSLRELCSLGGNTLRAPPEDFERFDVDFEGGAPLLGGAGAGIPGDVEAL